MSTVAFQLELAVKVKSEEVSSAAPSNFLSRLNTVLSEIGHEINFLN